MGMCKECGEVFSVLEMTNCICKNCAKCGHKKRYTT
jgi:predicted  nucleic acid-binding Zn-ribbon protein